MTTRYTLEIGVDLSGPIVPGKAPDKTITAMIYADNDSDALHRANRVAKYKFGLRSEVVYAHIIDRLPRRSS